MMFVNSKRLYSFILASVLSFPAIAAHTDIADRVVRRGAAGIDVLVYPMEPKNVVSIGGVMPLGDAGTASKSANPAVPELTTMMLERGTTKHDKFVISETLDGLGAYLGVEHTSPAFIAFGGKSLSQDLPTLISLLAEQLRTPAFSAEEFAKVKEQLKARVIEDGEDPDSRAADALALAMYPKESMNSPVPRDVMLKAIASATLDEIKNFHKKYYGPTHMTLVATGDVDPDKVQRLVADAFAGWSGGMDFARAASDRKLLAASEQSIAMADKASVSVMMGQATGLRTDDPDYLPLSVGVHVLGSGFTGRLMSNVRDKEGLTYDISAVLTSSEITTGSFMVGTSFAPQLLDKGVASTRRELATWWAKGVTQDELDARKLSLVGEHLLGMEGTGAMGNTILIAVVRGVPLTWLDDYPNEVRALTVNQINAAIRKYVDPSKLVMVKAGTFSQP